MRIKLLLTLLIFWILLAPACMTFRKSDRKMKKQFEEKGFLLKTTTLNVEDRHIHYAQTGSDSLPTIFFIHGTPGSWDAFASYLRDTVLLSKYRLVSIDRPGFGYSDFGDAVNLKRQSELMRPVFTKLDNKKPAYLVGHSLGGPMILKLAVDHPGFFSGLVVLAGSVDPAQEKPERWRPWIFKTPFNLLIPGAMRPSNVELWYLKNDLKDLERELPSVNIPVHILHGDKDMLVPFANTDFMKKKLTGSPKVELIVFPGENHFIPWTKFKPIRELLMQLEPLDASTGRSMASQQ